MDKLYNLKDGKIYEFIENYTDNRIIVKDENKNELLLSKADSVSIEEVNKFKNIFKMLCFNGEIHIQSRYVTQRGEIYWDRDGIGSCNITNYIESKIILNNEVLLQSNCKIER